MPTNFQIKAIYPLDINNLGDVVGFWQSSVSSGSTKHAFLFSNGTLLDLASAIGGSGDSIAYGTNDYGQVVGTYTPNGSGGTLSGFIFTLEGGMRALTPGKQSNPKAINNAGQIAGYTQYVQNSACRSYQCPAVFLQNGTILF